MHNKGLCFDISPYGRSVTDVFIVRKGKPSVRVKRKRPEENVRKDVIFGAVRKGNFFKTSVRGTKVTLTDVLKRP